MKAFDANLDRSSRDNGFDLLASRSMSREIDSTMRAQFSERQKLTVGANYFAMACPIMPLGLFSVFMMLDKLGAPVDKEQLKRDELVSKHQELTQTQALYLAAMKQKKEIEQKKGGLACSRPVEGLLPLGDKRAARKKKDSDVLFDGKPTERLNGPVLLSKSQTDVSKLVKTKMALQSHLEEASKEQDYGLVCRVSSRIELLEKALKKLGC